MLTKIIKYLTAILIGILIGFWIMESYATRVSEESARVVSELKKSK